MSTSIPRPSQPTPQPRLHPLLAQYLLQLAIHPLRTKALTSATLSFLQEVIGSNVAGLPPSPTPRDAFPLSKVLAKYHLDAKAVKMAIYGFFVSAPLGHYLVGLLQKAFAGKVAVKYRVAQLLASNLLVAPVQTTVFLASMALINGAKSLDEVIRTVKGGFWAVIRVTWIVSPLSMVFAQRFLPMEVRPIVYGCRIFVTRSTCLNCSYGSHFSTWYSSLLVRCSTSRQRRCALRQRGRK
ncbi:hypothetical protein EDC04DRAFT_2619822 [Pisolithus marmoratus]|nr:hypothetical protein EDC04DRAFT_2619822 [Pisolithus marmoratus]